MNIKMIIRMAMIAAFYAALTYAVLPIAYAGVQFRISEVLVLLCFYRRDYRWGLILGCILANIFSPMGIYDVLFGTLATALSVLLISYSRNLFVASLYPVIFNGIVIGLELNLILDFPLWLSMGQVAIGEFTVVSLLGVILFKILEKDRPFMELIEANQNLSR